MDKEQVQKAISELKKTSTRKFTQSYDLVINLKNLVIKSNPISLFVTLHYPKGKGIKVACFCDQQLAAEAEKNCDLVIKDTDFPNYTDKKVLKKLAVEYDYFIAQANLMPKVAQTFGKVLGIRGKMPNPKLGCVVPPSATLEPLVKKLNATVSLSANKATNLQCLVGKQDQPDEQIIDNIMTVYQAVLKSVPNEHQNIKNVTLKLTMSKPVKLG
jgi:large subunit ribosomal protein L1